ncbi:MAG TPA: universal stress protein [Acidimicrobiia bacterium]|nr:universal stress protein [Acidimicrobiia bacterium]
MTRTLAFGDDRSAEADRCWDWIANHRWDGWSLEVVHADPPADLHPVPSEESELHPWEPDEPRHQPDLGFTTVEHLRAAVDPRVALIARPWDLVAIGPKGSGFLKAMHLGSTADWLLREPVSPLLIARGAGPVRKILVGVDGSAHSRRAIATLNSLPWLSGVSIRLLAVDDGRVDTEAALQAAGEELSDSEGELETITRAGGATREILSEIEVAQPDLVVMGARGHAGLKRLILGSSTSAVAGSADVSLLVAHAEPDDA